MAILYRTDGTQQDIRPASGTQFTIAELQKLVGGYVERVILQRDQRLIVDEDAKLKGKPVNEQASYVLHRHFGAGTVAIAGDAVAGTKKEFGLG